MTKRTEPVERFRPTLVRLIDGTGREQVFEITRDGLVFETRSARTRRVRHEGIIDAVKAAVRRGRVPSGEAAAQPAVN